MLQVRMRGASYRTAYVGEYLPYYGYPNMTEVPPGWDQWIALTGGGKQMYDYTLNMNGQLRRYGSAPRDYMTDVLAGHAVQLVPPGSTAPPAVLSHARNSGCARGRP